ncbi:TUBULIN-FOLDING COFACTOR E family protein [Tripterygium wilfordii]|uniref:TUBULIN-FOLDING COFACTOR E family protein n=1 Tax=Tripterygium wilfordii TaxID=458696 RepID=A0A7J7D6F4_TRIWF|nr:tubulin-folding cofactor E [Tripterygium wilfordii]XP_038714573.1 tubulin-folding cofactor E [Tripterygium wilfordii]KAF5741940.1 TUBULIN-FOLDING COFACTOR E family protein [Tripterygium wilfordii]
MQGQAPESQFRLDQRVHSSTDSRRVGTVKYVGPVEGYSGTWVGVDWDNGEGKNDGSINGVRYFQARSERSASFVRTQNLSSGISLLQALDLRYKAESTQEEEDEMYVLSASNKRVSVQLLGKEKIQDQLSRFEELTNASLFYMGVSTHGDPWDISSILPNLKELDLTGNLLSEWKDVGIICEQLPALAALNLSYNLMSLNIGGLPHLKSIRILVLNNTGIHWAQVEILKNLLPALEELHLMGNGIGTIELNSQSTVHGFDSLRLLNLENNCIAEWNEILKLSQLKSLEQLHLNKNNLKHICYPGSEVICELLSGSEYHESTHRPFHNLRSLLVGGNNIEDVASIDTLNSFPKLVDIRLSENPIADPGRGGLPRFVLVARLAKVETLNGSEVSPRERKESEIRYVRLVMSNFHDNPEEMKKLHPRFTELQSFHGIEDERPSIGTAGPQKMASGLLSVTLKCVGASIGEKPPLTKKLPATTTVGKLKILCESFFKLKSIKPKIFLLEKGSPLPILLDDGMATLLDLGIGNESTILVDEES